jgi:dCTP deaminase
MGDINFYLEKGERTGWWKNLRRWAEEIRSPSRSGGILSDSAILKNIAKGSIQISPFNPLHVNPVSVDLTLGRNVVEYVIDGPLDARVPPKTKNYKIPDEGILLQPGRAYLMHTEEALRSDKYVTVLDGKSSLGRLFISVHETAGYIDVGFEGQITLEVSVAHFVRVYAGMRFCQVRYHSVVGEPTPYEKKGHYKGALARGAVASLAHEQLRESGF